MNKIFALFALSPLFITACAITGGGSEVLEYRFDDISCEGSYVTLEGFEVKYNEIPETTPVLIIQFEEDGKKYEMMLGNPYASEELGDWVERDMKVLASPNTCKYYKTELKFL